MSGEVIRNAPIDKSAFNGKGQDGAGRIGLAEAEKGVFSGLKIKRMEFFPRCEEFCQKKNEIG